MNLSQECRYGTNCKYLQLDKCKYYHPVSKNDASTPCKNGINCKYSQSGNCKYYHPTQSTPSIQSISKIIIRAPCKDGLNCENLYRGNCQYQHTEMEFHHVKKIEEDQENIDDYDAELAVFQQQMPHDNSNFTNYYTGIDDIVYYHDPFIECMTVEQMKQQIPSHQV